MEQLINRGIEALYEDYLSGVPENKEEARLSGISAALDTMIESKSVTYEIAGMYEEAARRAGFYAGVRAVMALMGNK